MDDDLLLDVPMTNVYEDIDGVETLVYRPMNAEELAQRKLDQEEAEARVELKPPLEQLADYLETLPPDRVVSASDMLAILRPEEPNPDGT